MVGALSSIQHDETIDEAEVRAIIERVQKITECRQDAFFRPYPWPPRLKDSDEMFLGDRSDVIFFVDKEDADDVEIQWVDQGKKPIAKTLVE